MNFDNFKDLEVCLFVIMKDNKFDLLQFDIPLILDYKY